MKQQRIGLLALLLLMSLAACSPGHLGSTVIAFIRNGHLWTIDPNGANAFDIAAQSTPVIGYSWSPSHQILAFRTLDSDFAKTSAGKHLSTHSVATLFPDVPSTLNTIGVDGGSPIPIAFSSPDIRYSNTIWDSDSSRLLFRQTGRTLPTSPNAATWWVSQNDQPGGIAIKSLPASYSIPSLSYISQNYKVLGNSTQGIFTTTLTGANQSSVLNAAIPGHPLPASLERVLWQPAHQDQSMLYTVASPDQQSTDTSSLNVQLTLRTLTGRPTTLATCTCTQFAWSPDGNSVLYSAGTTYTVLHLPNKTSFSMTAEQDSVPYWSPDSHFLLLDGPHNLLLINSVDQQQKSLLADHATITQPATGKLPTTNTLLQPVPNSLWAADSRHFLFLTHSRLRWLEQPLHAGPGLYTVALDDMGHPQGTPTMVDNGNDTQAGWTYQDANTSFLY